jgi:transcriptional regulator with XRE-family HTH domain
MEALTRIRKERGWSQRELSKRAGVNAATVNHAETGKRTPETHTLQKLAKALDVDISDLLGATRSQDGLVTFIEQQIKLATQVIEAIEDAEVALEENDIKYTRRFLAHAKTSARLIEEGERDLLEIERRYPNHEAG